MKNLKIAIFYDWLNCWGGAERLLLDILSVFPKSTLFTTIYDTSKAKWLPQKTEIIKSPLDKFFKKNNLLVGLLQPLSVEQFDFSGFDIVISLTSQNGKALITPPGTLHICYCLNPNRYLYQKKYPTFLKPILNILKKVDYIYAQRPDVYFSISKTVQDRIKKHYNKKSILLYPGTNTTHFTPAKNISTKKDFYLSVSRLVPHKKIDLLINTFKNNNRLLYIVGTGRQKKYLENLAKNHQNIKFLGNISDQKLINLYQSSQALICPQIEDFGLSPIEAQACGCPVIAFNKAGFKETIVNGKTGMFFNKQSINSLQKTLDKFEKNKINSTDCRKQALKFSKNIFMLNLKKQVIKQWQQYQINQTNTS